VGVFAVISNDKNDVNTTQFQKAGHDCWLAVLEKMIS
jgi:hypothetical protein